VRGGGEGQRWCERRKTARLGLSFRITGWGGGGDLSSIEGARGWRSSGGARPRVIGRPGRRVERHQRRSRAATRGGNGPWSDMWQHPTRVTRSGSHATRCVLGGPFFRYNVYIFCRCKHRAWFAATKLLTVA
jgi:hypothetical protein